MQYIRLCNYLIACAEVDRQQIIKKVKMYKKKKAKKCTIFEIIQKLIKINENLRKTSTSMHLLMASSNIPT